MNDRTHRARRAQWQPYVCGLLALSAACGDGTRTTANASAVTDSAGITIVTSAHSVWGEQGASLDSTPLLRIGAEEAGPYQFAFIRSGLLLDGGSVAVSDVVTSDIRIFDADGQHLRTIGRRGAGPGEFSLITGPFRKSDDSITVYDPRQRRVTTLPLAGGEPHVANVASVPTTRGSFDAFGAFGDGRILLYNPGGGFHPELQPGLQWVHSEVAVLDPADGSSRLVATLPSREQFVLAGGDTKRGAPEHIAVHAAASDGFFWATSDRYEIKFFNTEGVLRRILRRPVEPQAVTPAMTEAYIAQELEQVRRRDGEEAVERARQMFADASVAERRPLFETAFVDRDARLWIASSTWPHYATAPHRWSIFAADGSWLGDVVVPPQLRVLDSRDDLVLGVWQDDGEAPFVHVHRLRRP